MTTTTARIATLFLVAALVAPVEGQGKRRFTEYRDVYRSLIKPPDGGFHAQRLFEAGSE